MIQDASQGLNWKNAQATLHPLVAYYSQQEITWHITFCS
jgi:hypothetical protein